MKHILLALLFLGGSINSLYATETTYYYAWYDGPFTFTDAQTACEGTLSNYKSRYDQNPPNCGWEANDDGSYCYVSYDYKCRGTRRDTQRLPRFPLTCTDPEIPAQGLNGAWGCVAATPPEPEPEPEPEKKYTIKLSPVTAQAYGNYLTAIEPDGITRSSVPQNLINQVNLVAEVKDQDGNRVNAAIKLKVTAIDGSGGHDQESHTERNPSQAGNLKFDPLNSHTIDISKSDMIDGIVEFVYATSEISGDHKIEASCTDITCKQIGQDSVWVGIQDLRTLPGSSNYTFTGGSCHHQNNHYATERVIEKLQGIGRDYRSNFPNDPFLVFNDISLERGGLFDAKNEDDCTPVEKANWTATHNLHRTGEDADVRANNLATAIPAANYDEFKVFARANGCYAGIHLGGTSAQHFHLYCTQQQGR